MARKKDRPEGSAPSGPSSVIESTIGPNAHFRGEIQSDGGIRVSGVFEGEIDTTGNLVIGEGAKVIADIKANNVSISGAVKGNVNADRVEILETGRVWGDLMINSLLLNEGAYLRGQTTMHGDIEPPLIEAPKSETASGRSKGPVTAPPPPTILDVEAKKKVK